MWFQYGEAQDWAPYSDQNYSQASYIEREVKHGINRESFMMSKGWLTIFEEIWNK